MQSSVRDLKAKRDYWSLSLIISQSRRFWNLRGWHLLRLEINFLQVRQDWLIQFVLEIRSRFSRHGRHFEVCITQVFRCNIFFDTSWYSSQSHYFSNLFIIKTSWCLDVSGRKLAFKNYCFLFMESSINCKKESTFRWNSEFLLKSPSFLIGSTLTRSGSFFKFLNISTRSSKSSKEKI